jgi:hypothetical protein
VIFHLHFAESNNFWAGEPDFSKIKISFQLEILLAQKSHAGHAQRITTS